MKSKIKFITAFFILMSCHAFAQHGHSINSNSIIHQMPRMNSSMHANTNAINHANSNSIFGNSHNQSKHDNKEKEDVKEAIDKDKAKKDNKESNNKHKKARKKFIF